MLASVAFHPPDSSLSRLLMRIAPIGLRVEKALQWTRVLNRQHQPYDTERH